MTWPGMGINFGWHTYSGGFNLSNELDYIKSRGITKLRMVFNVYNPSFRDWARETQLLAKQKGFYVIGGCSANGNPAGMLSTSNWADYQSKLLTEATIAQANGIDEFCIENEPELHNDGSFGTTGDLYKNYIIPEAATIKSVFHGLVSFSISNGAEVWLPGVGGKGQVDRVGFNLYGDLSGHICTLSSFQTRLKNILAYTVWGPLVYISEFNTNSNGSYWKEEAADESVLRADVQDRLNIVKSCCSSLSEGSEQSMDAYYFCWRYSNTDDAFSIMRLDGSYRKEWDDLTDGYNDQLVPVAALPHTGINFGWHTDGFSRYDLETEMDFLKSWGVNRLRIVANVYTPSHVSWARETQLLAKQKGMYVLGGCSAIRPVTKLTSSNFADYQSKVLTEAAYAESIHVDEFCIGNEEELHIDGTTIIDPYALYYLYMRPLATAVRAVYSGKITFSISNGAESWIYGIAPFCDTVGFNCYGDLSGQVCTTATFKSRITNFKANSTWGSRMYISEFNTNYNSTYWVNEANDVKAMQANLMDRIAFVRSLDIDFYFFCWVYSNTINWFSMYNMNASVRPEFYELAKGGRPDTPQNLDAYSNKLYERFAGM